MTECDDDLNKVCSFIHERRMQHDVYDAMDVVAFTVKITQKENIRSCLAPLIDGDCLIDLPANITNPIKLILREYGLLDGIVRHISCKKNI